MRGVSAILGYTWPASHSVTSQLSPTSGALHLGRQAQVCGRCLPWQLKQPFGVTFLEGGSGFSSLLVPDEKELLIWKPRSALFKGKLVGALPSSDSWPLTHPPRRTSLGA